MPILNYNQGLEDAAKLLERTAQDREQMATQERQFAARCGNHLTRTPHIARSDKFTEDARLLRGQAMHIRGLCK